MTDFLSIFQNSEKPLLAEVMKNARGQHHYLAAVEEVWNLSFQGLTTTLLKAEAAGALLDQEPGPSDPVAAFGREEARRHRERGVSLEMFLGLLKIFRPSYLEIVRRQVPDEPGRSRAVGQILRFFDRVETSFCLAWVREAEAGSIKALEDKNLELVTERDSYLAVLESIPMPVILLDPDLSVRYLNHAAYRLFFRTGAPGAWHCRPGGRPGSAFLTELFPGFFQDIEAFLRAKEGSAELAWSADRDGAAMSFRVVVSRMLDLPDAFAGILVTLDDQTERVQAARERERMLAELQAALAEVGSLSSLLPICAWCKKIRNDQGYWDQLEGYLAARAGIVFSHGICPDCAARVRAGEFKNPAG